MNKKQFLAMALISTGSVSAMDRHPQGARQSKSVSRSVSPKRFPEMRKLFLGPQNIQRKKSVGPKRFTEMMQFCSGPQKIQRKRMSESENGKFKQELVDQEVQSLKDKFQSLEIENRKEQLKELTDQVRDKDKIKRDQDFHVAVMKCVQREIFQRHKYFRFYKKFAYKISHMDPEKADFHVKWKELKDYVLEREKTLQEKKKRIIKMHDTLDSMQRQRKNMQGGTVGKIESFSNELDCKYPKGGDIDTDSGGDLGRLECQLKEIEQLVDLDKKQIQNSQALLVQNDTGHQGDPGDDQASIQKKSELDNDQIIS